jgi:hypothetical protein
MTHDHAQSELDRQQHEWRDALARLATERQVNLVFEGALTRIASPTAHLGTGEIARDALAAASKLRKP